MQAYGAARRFQKRAAGTSLVLALVLPGVLLTAACTSQVRDGPSAYTVSGNHEDIASCLYREAEGSHTVGWAVHLTRLTNPAEIRVAVAGATGKSGLSLLSWEVELLPQGGSKVRLLVRKAGTLQRSDVFWSSYLEPAITRCAGSAPVAAP